MRQGLSSALVAHAGPNLATTQWIEQCGLATLNTPSWYVEVSISTAREDTRCELNVYPDEWGVIFRRGIRVSSVRVTDVAFVHGRDDDNLLRVFPSLDRVRNLITLLEHRFDLAFDRAGSAVHSNLTRASAIIRGWLLEKSR